MRHWIAKLKISEAVRHQTALSPLWQKHVDREPELQAFERRIRELDVRLRTEARNRTDTVPPDLRRDIMRVIAQEHGSNRQPARAGFPLFLRRTPLAGAATALALALLTLVFWRVVNPPTPDPSVHLSQQPARPIVEPTTLPAPNLLVAQLGPLAAGTAVDPMTAQLEALSLDARSAAQFLLESLP